MPNNAIQARNSTLTVTQSTATQTPANNLALGHNVEPQNTEEAPRSNPTEKDLRSASDTGNRLSLVTPETKEILTPESLVKKLRNIFSEGENKDKLQSLIPLIHQQSYAFKTALVNYVFDNKTRTQSEVLKILQLGDSREDSKLRQTILQKYIKTPPKWDTATRIFNLAPDQRDIGLLITLVQKLSISDPGEAFDLLFALNHKLPDQQSNSIPNPNARVMPLPIDSTIELLKDILRNRILYQNRKNLYVDIDTAKLVTLSKGIFTPFEKDPFIKALKSEFERQGLFNNENNFEFFTYIAILTHNIQIPSDQKRVFIQLCIQLVKIKTPGNIDAIDYIMSHIEEPKKMNFILEHLDFFHNKLLGLALIYLLENNNSSLLKPIASTLNISKTTEKNYQIKNINIIYDFISTNLINHTNKQKIASLWLNNISPKQDLENSLIDMLSTILRISTIINKTVFISEAYTNRLAHAKNKQEIKSLLYPDSFVLIEAIKAMAREKTERLFPIIENYEEEISVLHQHNIDYPSMKFSFEDKISIARASIEPELNNWSANRLYDVSIYLKDNIFSDGEFQNILEIEEIAERFPLLEKIFKIAKDKNNIVDGVWSNIAACISLCLDENVTSSKIYNDALQQIASFRGDYSRIVLTLSLMHYFKKYQNNNSSFFDASSPKSSKIFQIPLALLSENGKYKSDLEFLYHLIKLPQYGDTKKAMPLASLISYIALYNGVTTQQKVQLLRRATSTEIKHLKTIKNLEHQKNELTQKRAELHRLKNRQAKEKTPPNASDIQKKLKEIDKQLQNAKSQFKNYLEQEYPTTTSVLLNIIGELFGLGFQDPTISNKISMLMSPNQETDLENITMYFMQTVFQLTPQESPEFLKKHNTYVNNARNPSALHTYAASHYGSTLAKNDGAAVLQFIKDLVQNASTNDYALFKQNRYNTANSENNRMLQHLAPQSWEIWQKPFVSRILIEYTSPDLKAGIDKSKQFKVSISDSFDDLFLSGTELSNSCQSVYSPVEINIALLANVLDGKYQVGVIHNENNNIMARRMLRLMWSDTHKKQVIFVERHYDNPGVPTKTDQILIDLIREKARQMDALVATRDMKLINKDNSNTSTSLRSWPTSLPFEYVDAFERTDYLGNMVAGSKGVIIEKAFLI